MAYSSSDLAQGTIEEFPMHHKMQWELHRHHAGTKPFRFTLVTEGVEQEVQLIKENGHGSPGDGSWYTVMTVCPVETLETLKGARIIHIDVNRLGFATYY